MIEPFPQKTATTSPRKGFALLITLSVLTVVIALTAVMMGYLDSARRDAVNTKALIQANLYFVDIKKVFMSVKDKKSFYKVLYQTPIPLQSENDVFSVLLDCKPMDNGININWLGQGNNPKTKVQYTMAQKVFDTLVQSYDLADPTRLEEILLQSMSGGNGYDRDEMQSRLHQKNGIISYQQFTQLVEKYQFETDDRNVGRIKWKDYFVFNPVKKGKKSNMISGDYLSPALVAILFDIDEESVKEIWSGSQGSLRKLLTQFGIDYDKKLFTEKITERAVCEVMYKYQTKQYYFTFRDIEGEVKDFAFYGKQ
jgi:hypothetical protein